MLNILFVLQELSRPIKKDKVDLISIYNPATSSIRINDDDVRVNCSKDRFIDWSKELSKFLQISQNYRKKILKIKFLS